MAGLRDDFAIRVRSAVESMRDQSTKDGDVPAKKSKGRLHLQQNKGVQARAKADFEMQEVGKDKVYPGSEHSLDCSQNLPSQGIAHKASTSQ